MARKQGQSNVSFDFEVRATSPLDARTYVDNYTDLTSEAAFKSGDGNNYAYEKMRVVVKKDPSAGLYQLQNYALGLSPTSYVWQRIEVSDANLRALYNAALNGNSAPKAGTLANAIYEGTRKTIIVNNLTTNDASLALSAAMGKNLDERITSISKALIYKGSVNTYADLWALITTDTTVQPGHMYNVKNDVTYEQFKASGVDADVAYQDFVQATLKGYKPGDIIFSAGTNFAWKEYDPTKGVSASNGCWDALGGAADDGIYEEFLKTDQKIVNISTMLSEGDIAPAWHIVE